MTTSKPVGQAGTVAIGCSVLVLVAVVMLVVGDPIWNLYVVSLGLFVALPAGLISVGLLLRSRRSPDDP